MISFDYVGKTVLVTGAGRGLGLAIATAFYQAGATVFVNDRTAAQLDPVVRKLGGGMRLIAAPGDLATFAGMRAAMAPVVARGVLDIIVNNAAVNIEKTFADTDDTHWDLHLAVDLKAPFFIVRQALPLLARSKGCVINIASELGLHAIPNNVAYVSAKHGLVALTKAMAIELAPKGIRVNALCPGTMDTELMKDCAEASGDAVDYYRRARAYHPLNRLASPEEIASFVLCLASPAAAYMTGSAIPIDGGSTAGRLDTLFGDMRVLITGSTRGVGRATAQRFLEEGASVIVHGRTKAAAEKAARELGSSAKCTHGDLADRTSIASIAKAAGDIDVLVNCAGIFEEKSIEDADEAHWDRIIEVNLSAAWALSRALMDGLARRNGVIVNVSSDSGLLGYAKSTVYCASKGALIGLTRAIAVELAPKVRAVAVCPGPVDTDMMRENSAPDQWADFPILKRVAQASEVAEAILFAASPKATFQTGSVITIDGGSTAGKRM